MFYIVNQTNHIIAADSSLLALLCVDNLDDLHRSIALGTIEFSTATNQDLNITVSGESQNYSTKLETLSSLLGTMTLIEVLEADKRIVEDTNEITYQDDISIMDDEPITFHDVEDKDEIIEEVKEEEISILEDDKPFDLISDEEISVVSDIPEEEKEEEKESVETVQANDNAEIFIDIQSISHKIGISEEDYTNFLNEYIDTALTLEEDLKSSQEKKRTHAIDTLSHLSNVLHLPLVTDIVENIKGAIDDEDNGHIQSLYNTLAKLTTSKETPSKEEVPAEPLEVEEIAVSSDQGFGTINLSNIKPIHFDFQLEEAANDLSLPVELIEEFVIDFLEQAHDETKKMLDAYEKGDLSTIQKIGHLLKGTSSNLRIKPLSDTLYKIQFCEDSSQLEDLIKEYWAHFLSFEHQINTKLN